MFSRRKVVCIAICILVSATSLSAKQGKFTILSLNDTHSHLYPYMNSENGEIYGGAARWKTIIDQVRNEVGDILVLHGGDALTGSDSNYFADEKPDWNRLPSYGYKGLLDFPVLNSIGLDAMSLGNHEFDYGLSWFLSLLRSVDFKMLSSNITMSPIVDTKDFDLMRTILPYALFERDGLTIAVIGVTTQQYIKSIQIGLVDPKQAVQAVVEDVSGKADVVVVLSHLGFDLDQELAEVVDEIDIIVGGHTHTLLEPPVHIGDTIITQVGDYGQYIGRLDVTVESSKVSKVDFELIPIDLSVPEDPEVAQFLKDALVIGRADQTYTSDNTQRSSMATLILNALQKETGTNAAMYMNRLAEGTLEKGVITPRAFFDVFWPYRARELGPDKDMMPSQILDILQGKAPRYLRQLFYIAGGVSNLVHMRLSSDTIREVIEFNETLVASPQFLQIAVSDQALKQKELTVVMDLQTCRLLYEARFIDGSVLPTKVEDRELFEFMLEVFDKTK